MLFTSLPFYAMDKALARSRSTLTFVCVGDTALYPIGTFHGQKVAPARKTTERDAPRGGRGNEE